MLRVQSQITQIRTLEDRGLKISVETVSSLHPEDIAKLFELRDKVGWFVFKETGIVKEDLDLPDVEVEKGIKSHAQRLRGVIFRLGEKKGIKIEDSEAFYRGQMELLISKYKEKLDK